MEPRKRRECPDCETIYFTAGPCPSCGWSPASVVAFPEAAAQAPTWLPSGPKPCTREQNAAATQILRDILGRVITAEEGRTRMAALFPGVEAEA